MSNQMKQLIILGGYLAMVIGMFESELSMFDNELHDMIFRIAITGVLSVICVIASICLGEEAKNG